MFNILLVPLDGSPQSVYVIDLAGRVAAPGTATVHFLCVVDPSYALPPGYESGVAPDGLTYPPAQAQTSFARSVLAAAAAQLADRNLTVEQHFCAGNPADVVIEQPAADCGGHCDGTSPFVTATPLGQPVDQRRSHRTVALCGTDRNPGQGLTS